MLLVTLPMSDGVDSSIDEAGELLLTTLRAQVCDNNDTLLFFLSAKKLSVGVITDIPHFLHSCGHRVCHHWLACCRA